MKLINDILLTIVLMTRTLIYPGAGWDNLFLNEFSQYERYVLMDILPSKYCETPEIFFQNLEISYGKIISHNVENQIIYFPNNVEYWYNRNVNNIKHIPRGDVLLNGFIPDSSRWRHLYKQTNVNVFIGCTTYFGEEVPSKSIVVHYHKYEEDNHLCQGYFQFYDDDSDDDSNNCDCECCNEK